jgi:TM2 domain-containing membrane protein YozV
MPMYCSNCGTQNAETAKFCEKCGTGLVATPPPAAQTETRMRGVDSIPVRTGQPVTGKNATLATLLSLIPGLGQVYNNDYKKGALMFIGAMIGSALTAGILWLVFVVWSMYDAYQVATGNGKIW